MKLNMDKEAIMKEYRLFTILYHLLTYSHSTTTELAKICEVSKRTILRDLDVLTLHNIPIYTKSGRNGGVFLNPHFLLDRRLLTASEQTDILFALATTERLLQHPPQTLAQKISSLLSQATPSKIDIDLSRWGQTINETTQVSRLKTAIFNKQFTSFNYHNADNNKSSRLVKPLKLTYKNYYWYLQAFCTTRQMVRTFKLTRMSKVKVLEQIFSEDHPLVGLDTFEDASQTTLTLRFKEAIRIKLIDHFSNCHFRLEKDGHYADIPVEDSPWLYPHLLSFGNQIEVVRPVAIRETLKHEIEKLTQLYF